MREFCILSSCRTQFMAHFDKLVEFMHGECMEMNVETGLINLLQRESSEILKALSCQGGKSHNITLYL